MCVSDFDHEQEIDKTGNEALRGRSLQTTFHRLSAAPVEELLLLRFLGGKEAEKGLRYYMALRSTIVIHDLIFGTKFCRARDTQRKGQKIPT